jgi:hypothetical protein
VNAPDVIGQTIEGEAIILHLGSGFYYSTKGSGPLVWDLLGASHSFEEISSLLAAQFEVTVDEVEPALRQLIEQMCEEGLLVAADEAVVPQRTAPATPADRLAFVPPTLEKFTDMEDLLLLDPVHEVSPERGWPHVAPGVDA